MKDGEISGHISLESPGPASGQSVWDPGSVGTQREDGGVTQTPEDDIRKKTLGTIVRGEVRTSF